MFIETKRLVLTLKQLNPFSANQRSELHKLKSATGLEHVDRRMVPSSVDDDGEVLAADSDIDEVLLIETRTCKRSDGGATSEMRSKCVPIVLLEG